MKRYNDYMDGVETSDTLHERLKNLEEPKKKTKPWVKYGGLAAALVLTIGAGAWGLSRFGGDEVAGDAIVPGIVDVFQEDAPAIGTVGPGREDMPVPEPFPVDPNDPYAPADRTNGGYEIVDGEMVCYYFLPYIEYGMANNRSEMALDWDVPPGSTRRDLTQADIAALFGRENALSDHLAWGGYRLSGWAAWYEDGSLWGVFLNGDKGEQDRFEFAFVTGDHYPPTCIGYFGGVEQTIWDLTVTAWGYDGPNGYDRRVEFMTAGCGFRFDMTASDQEQAATLVSRLVRWIAVEGLELNALTDHGAVLAHPWEADPGYSVGEPNWEDGIPDKGFPPEDAPTANILHPGDPGYIEPFQAPDGVADEDSDGFDPDCPYCADGTVHSHPYAAPSAPN